MADEPDEDQPPPDPEPPPDPTPGMGTLTADRVRAFIQKVIR